MNNIIIMTSIGQLQASDACKQASALPRKGNTICP